MIYHTLTHKTHFIQIGCEDVGCIYVAQDRIQWQDLVNMIMNFHVPLWSISYKQNTPMR